MHKEVFNLTKTTLYTYYGINGVIQSPVLLETLNISTSVRLIADTGKKLTRDDSHYVSSITVLESEVGAWKEVDDSGQE